MYVMQLRNRTQVVSWRSLAFFVILCQKFPVENNSAVCISLFYYIMHRILDSAVFKMRFHVAELRYMYHVRHILKNISLNFQQAFVNFKQKYPKETAYSSATFVPVGHTVRSHIPERQITYLILRENAKFRICDSVISDSRRRVRRLLHCATHGLTVKSDGLYTDFMGNKIIIVPVTNRMM